MVIIVLPSVKEKEEGEYAFEGIKHMNLKVWSHSAFVDKMNNDKKFSIRVFQQQIKCFIKFELFKSKKYYSGLLKKGVPVFPIDSKKVPFCLQDTISSYPAYIQHLAEHYVAVTRSGAEQYLSLHAEHSG